jgi:hypothetical protein
MSLNFEDEMDDDIIQPVRPLEDKYAMDIVETNYTMGKPKVMLKINGNNKVVMLCFCGNPVKQQNTTLVCKNVGSQKSYCCFKAQIAAMDILVKKGIFKPEMYLNTNNLTDEKEIKDATEKAKIRTPRCTSCKQVSVALSNNKIYTNVFGKIYFTCACVNDIRNRLNMEITDPAVAQYFNLEEYNLDLVNKRAELNAGGVSEPKKKKMKGGLKVDSSDEE